MCLSGQRVPYYPEIPAGIEADAFLSPLIEAVWACAPYNAVIHSEPKRSFARALREAKKGGSHNQTNLARLFCKFYRTRVLPHVGNAILIPIPRKPESVNSFPTFLVSQLVQRHSFSAATTGLRWIRDVPDLRQLSPTNRGAAVAGALAISRTTSVSDVSVVLVDDVLSSGSTLAAAASALRDAGAHRVFAATLAYAERQQWVAARAETSEAVQGMSWSPPDLLEHPGHDHLRNLGTEALWEFRDAFIQDRVDSDAILAPLQPEEGVAGVRREFFFTADASNETVGSVQFIVVPSQSACTFELFLGDEFSEEYACDGWLSWAQSTLVLCYRPVDSSVRHCMVEVSPSSEMREILQAFPEDAEELLPVARLVARHAPR